MRKSLLFAALLAVSGCSSPSFEYKTFRQKADSIEERLAGGKDAKVVLSEAERAEDYEKLGDCYVRLGEVSTGKERIVELWYADASYFAAIRSFPEGSDQYSRIKGKRSDVQSSIAAIEKEQHSSDFEAGREAGEYVNQKFYDFLVEYGRRRRQ